MKYYKRIENGYITIIGIDCGGIEILEKEYKEILRILANKPQAEEGYDYKLKENLDWELIEIPIELVEISEEYDENL